MSRSFVQLSDLHILPEGQTHVGIDTAAHLRSVVADIRDRAIDPAFIIVSGDIVHDRSVAAYEHARRLFAELLEPFAVPVLLGVGNHDSRSAFRATMLGEPGDAPYYYATVIDGLRVIMLDSSVPGASHGVIDADQLAWLGRLLDTPAPGGDLLVVHHPVTSRGIPKNEQYLLPADRDRLATVVKGRIMGVLTGHAHGAGAAAFAGTVATIAPGVCWLSDPANRSGHKIVDGCGYVLGAVRDGHLIVNPIVIPGDQPVVRHFPARSR